MKHATCFQKQYRCCAQATLSRDGRPSFAGREASNRKRVGPDKSGLDREKSIRQSRPTTSTAPHGKLIFHNIHARIPQVLVAGRCRRGNQHMRGHGHETTHNLRHRSSRATSYSLAVFAASAPHRHPSSPSLSLSLHRGNGIDASSRADQSGVSSFGPCARVREDRDSPRSSM